MPKPSAESARDLSEVKKRLQAGKLEKADLTKLAEFVRNAEEAVGKLRAAMIE